MQDVEAYMMPNLNPYGKSIWQNTLKLLDGEQLHPADYVMLEALCQNAQQLRQMNDEITKKPFIIIEGMIKANQLAWNAQSLIKSITLLSDKLGINRVMRKAGNDGTPAELMAFLRGEEDEVPT